MMNGIWFDNIHSFEDWNLVLSEVKIPPATAKTSFIDIPGGDGSIDMTEALGEVKFNDRTCTFSFTVFPYDDFEEKKREISNFLNGRRCKIIVDKDPDYYWFGRCSINEYATDSINHKIVVGAVVAPYKLKLDQTVITVQAGTNVIGRLYNSRKKVVPEILTTAKATIVFEGAAHTITGAGTTKILGIELVEGFNKVTVTSAEPVIFTYQEGDL